MKRCLVIILLFGFLFVPQHGVRAIPVVESGPSGVSNVSTNFQVIWQVIKERVLEPGVQKLASRILDKITDSTINWAVGGFDGSPGFITNWDQFLKETKFETLNTAIDVANQSVALTQRGILLIQTEEMYELCRDTAFNEYQDALGAGDNISDEAQAQSVYEDALSECDNAREGETDSLVSEAQAERNFITYQAEEVQDARDVARSVLKFGANELNRTGVVTGIIQQQGEDLTGLLGSHQARDDFFEGESFSWEAYLALTSNPENSPAARNVLLAAALGAESANRVNETIQKAQTPLRFLDREECLNDETEINPDTGLEECVRTVVTTPGQQVAEKLNEALVRDENQADGEHGLVANLLSSAVGQLTEGLIDGGLSAVANLALSEVNSAINVDFFAVDPVTGQTDYDVLASNSGTNSGDGTGSSTDSGFSSSIAGFDSGVGSIGGPEDDNGFGNSPQIIINLEPVLEQNIADLKEELSYYDQANFAKEASIDSVIGLDQCLPGPDLDWDQRFSDVFDVLSNDQNRLALTRTREMVADSRVNIPGSQFMSSSIDGIVADSTQETVSQARISDARSALGTLTFVQGQLLSQFNAVKSEINPNLVIFNEYWDELTSAEQRSAFQSAVDEGFYLLRDDESVAGIVTTENNRARDAVIALSWEVWRDNTPAGQKNSLRESYYGARNDLSNTSFIIDARGTAQEVENLSIQSQQYLADCMVFKAYALGESISTIQNIVNQTNGTTTEGLVNRIELLDDLLEFSVGGVNNPFGFLNDQAIHVDTSDARSDNQIRSFLEEERAQQLDNQTSIFLTNVITGNVTTSLLGFMSNDEKEEYFDTLYPEPDGSHIPNALSIAEVFYYDQAVLIGGNQPRGVLFCKLDSNSCYRNWYNASRLDYELSFSGI